MRITFNVISTYLSEKGYKIIKGVKAKHYIVTDNNGDKKHLYVNLTLKDLYADLEQIGIDKFMEKYDHETVIANKKQTRKGALKSNSRVKELEDAKVATTLAIMNLQVERGSKAHLDLRNQLHQIVNELRDLGVTKKESPLAIMSATRNRKRARK